MVRLFTDNLTGETIAAREQFNPWGDERIWVEIGRVPKTRSDIRTLTELTIKGMTAEQMYWEINDD